MLGGVFSNPCCCTGLPCVVCIDSGGDVISYNVTVVVANFPNECEDCILLNGTHNLTKDPELGCFFVKRFVICPVAPNLLNTFYELAITDPPGVNPVQFLFDIVENIPFQNPSKTRYILEATTCIGSFTLNHFDGPLVGIRCRFPATVLLESVP